MEPEDAPGPNDEMFSVAYDELRRLARRIKGASGGPTLNSTALVHEAYIKLSKSRRYRAESPEHLKFTVVRAMKHILLDAARKRAAGIRGGGDTPVRRVSLDNPGVEVAALDPEDVLSVGFALDELASRDELQGRVFELQFFGGLEIAEIASSLRLSEKRVQRLLRMARASLAVSLSSSSRASTGTSQ
jgi:RNA polymerase sigma factor (TIGR02999 family)